MNDFEIARSEVLRAMTNMRIILNRRQSSADKIRERIEALRCRLEHLKEVIDETEQP